MTLFIVYAGRRGSNLECALALNTLAKGLGADTKLLLSADNERKAKVEDLYSEAEFHNFFSPMEAARLRKEMAGHTVLFTMYSPKMVPLFLSLRAKKLFYFHATYDHSFSRPGFGERVEDHTHDVLIRNSTLALATQHPLAWQIRARLDKKAEVLPHPSYASIKPEFFSEDEQARVDFRSFFLTFGGVDRPSKGVEVLLEAVKGTKLNTVVAGSRAQINPAPNLTHMNRWLSDGEMHNLIKRSECVVLPYLVPSLFSGCLALSFHFRRPVLAPFSPAFEGLVEEDKTGWFFPSGDAESLREKMGEIWAGERKSSASAIGKKEKEMDGRTEAKLKELLERFGEL